jgi:hypothetical protein
MAILLCIATPLMITVFTPVTASAQIEWKDPLVTGAVGHQINPSIARPSQSDYTIVAWQDQRDAGAGWDIFIQKMSNTTGLPMWLPPDGVLVCGMPGDQIEPRAAFDELGGVIVTWIDSRNGAGTAVFAQRLDVTTGEIDPNWPATGSPVREHNSPVEHVRIVGNGDGAYITWLDHRFTPMGSGNDRRVFVQYLLSSTASWPQGGGFLWVQDGLQVAVNPGDDQEYPEIARDYIWLPDANQYVKTGCVIAYQNYTQHPNQQWYWNVSVNNFDASGNRRYGANDIPLATFESHQLYPRIVCGGAEPSADQPRAIVVWQDSRENPAIPRYDIMAQVVYADGSVSAPGTGEVICDVQQTQRRPVLALYERPEHWPNYGDPYIPYVSVAWEDMRDTLTTGIDLYGATLNARFIGLDNPSGSTGEAISQLPGLQTNPAIDHIGASNDLNIAWEHPSPYVGQSPNSDIHHQRAWIPSWYYLRATNGWPVTEAKSDQVTPEVGGEVFVFQDRRRGIITNDNRDDWDIHCQIAGECVGPTAMRWRDMWAKVTNISNALGYRMTTDDEHNVFVVWDEIRYPSEGRQVFVQKFDKHGVPRWTFGGVQVSNIDPALPTDDAKLADVAIDGNYGAQIVWQQTGPATEQVVYAHVPYDGDVTAASFEELDPPLGGGSLGLKEPRLVYSPAIGRIPAWGDGAIVVLRDSTAASVGRVYYRMDIGATPMTAYGPDAIPTGVQAIPYYYGLELVYDGDGGAHILSRAEDPAGPDKFINVTSMEAVNAAPPFIVHHDETRAFTDFNGYDIDVDLAWPAPHRPLLVYCISGPLLANVDIVITSYNNSFAVAVDGFSGLPIMIAGGHVPSQPKVVSDRIGLNGADYGGMLLAWDLEYPNPQLQRVHKVQSEHVLLYNDMMVPPMRVELDISMDLLESTWPEITYAEPQFAGQEPMAMIVWEGGGESSSCYPPRPTEIYTQYVGYEDPYRSLYWNQEMMVAPGPGNYHQRRPTIQPSEDGTYTVFWLDNWGGYAGPMGTRFYHIDGQHIGWKKKAEKPTATDFVVSVYPNPAHASQDAVRVHIDNDRDEYVRVRINDLLGRTVETLHDGELRAGARTFDAIFPRGRLHAGTYFVTVQSATRRSIVSLVVLP